MSTIGFIIPNFPDERRVALLPKDILAVRGKIIYDDIFIEEGFGLAVGISDVEYRNVGCKIVPRGVCFDQSHIFSLKLIQPADYHRLKKFQKVIGWMHPSGSGAEFCSTIANSLQLEIFDIDSVYPRIFKGRNILRTVENMPPHIFWKNSYIAGQASVKLAFDYLEIDPLGLGPVAVLGSGSVSQGAFQYLSSLGIEPRLFYRKTLNIFYADLSLYSLVVNGIELDTDDGHILSRHEIASMRDDAIIIDAAADAGRAIEGTEYLSINNPAGKAFGRTYTLVNNAPTLMHERASREISKVISQHILTNDFFELP